MAEIADDTADDTAVEPDSPSPDSIVLLVGDGRYALPTAAVAEITRVPPVTRLPGVPPWLAGLVNWRGGVLGVVDPAPLLGEPARRPAAPQRLLVLELDGAPVGLLCDGVAGLHALDTAGLAPPPDGPATALLGGQAVVEGRPVGLIEVSALGRLRSELPSGWGG